MCIYIYIFICFSLDISPLLICASENIASEQAADEEIIALLEGGPKCVSQNQLYKSGKDFSRIKSVMSVQRATWRIAKGKRLEIMMKTLKPNYTSYTKEFLDLADKWGKLRSGALIRLDIKRTLKEKKILEG